MITCLIGAVLLVYSLCIFYLRIRLPKWRSNTHLEEKTSFTIVVPSNKREELEGSALQQLCKLYGKQLVIVNDSQVKAFPKKLQGALLLENKGFGKKSALTTGIQSSSEEWIITTDADCTHQKGWAESMLSGNEKSEVILGPVGLDVSEGFLHGFEVTEHMALQGVTRASAAMNRATLANGANLAFKKATFQQLKGYESHEHVPSGDDVFLVFSAQERGASVGYQHQLSAAVYTRANSNWSDFFKQRRKWISKLRHYPTNLANSLAWSVLLANFFMACAMIYILFEFNGILLTGILLKLLADAVLAWPQRVLISKPPSFFALLYYGLLYPYYLIVLVIYSTIKREEVPK